MLLYEPAVSYVFPVIGFFLYIIIFLIPSLAIIKNKVEKNSNYFLAIIFFILSPLLCVFFLIFFIPLGIFIFFIGVIFACYTIAKEAEEIKKTNLSNSETSENSNNIQKKAETFNSKTEIKMKKDKVENECKGCGVVLNKESLFCHNCGKSINAFVRFCQFCGKFRIKDSKFCHKCGNPLQDNKTNAKMTESVPTKEEERCSNCGQKRRDKGNFCQYCGKNY